MEIINTHNYSRLLQYLGEFHISLSDYQLNQFEKYYNLLIEWNKKINLTSITDFEDVLLKHFIDSLSIIQFVSFNQVHSIIDIGTGAGFPGIPLKIIFPDCKFTLLDSLNKRISFLNTVVNELHLPNIELVHARAEDFSREIDHREKYDLCVSRAVANLSTLLEICTPFIKKDGLFVSYKSEKAEEELQSAKNSIFLLNCSLVQSTKFELDDNNRTLLLFKKTNSTPQKYPRKAGIPNKSPLN